MPRTSNPPFRASPSGDHAQKASAGDSCGADPIDVSRYVGDICGELSKMTKSAKLMMLSYLLAMARQEAERIARDGTVATQTGIGVRSARASTAP